LLRDVTGEWREAFQNYQCESATFRMNVALSELPDFSCLPGDEAQLHHRSGIIMAPSLAFMDRAHASAREHGWSTEPIVEMLIPSTVDDSSRRRESTSRASSASTFATRCRPEGSGMPNARPRPTR
jgi:phytoene dehydrogenase-like protein